MGRFLACNQARTKPARDIPRQPVAAVPRVGHPECLTKRRPSSRSASVSAKPAWKYGALAVTFALMLVVFLQPDQRPDFSDFKVYWLAGTKAAVHHTVYDVQGHYQYKYSPFVALLWAIPSTLLPGQRYHWAWLHYAACGCGFALLWWLLARAIDPARAFTWWLFLWIVFGVALRDELKLGQENLWPFLLVLPAW